MDILHETPIKNSSPVYFEPHVFSIGSTVEYTLGSPIGTAVETSAAMWRR